MLSCSMWFSAPSFWMGGGLESRCVGRVYGADGAVHRTHDLRSGSQDHHPSKNLVQNGAVHGTIRTVHTAYAAALKATTHPKTWCRKPHAATQHLMLLMMDVCTRNMSS